MGQSGGLGRSHVPPDVSALYLQIREAHTRDGWNIGGMLVAEKHHANLEERQKACASRPCELSWMASFCDSMENVFSDVYGAWPTAFFIFEQRAVADEGGGAGGGHGEAGGCGGSLAWFVAYRSRPTVEAYIDVTEVLDCLWGESRPSELPVLV